MTTESASSATSQVATALLPSLRASRRILFLGDSITYSGGYVDYVETWLRTRHPEWAQIEILNLGLPSETVSGLSEDGHAGGRFPRPDLDERLERVLTTVKPDTVFACYGMNCGIYLPFEGTRFSSFQAGITRLRAKCAAAGIKTIVHVTPPVFDEAKGGHPGYGETLARYSDWLVRQGATGWFVVDAQRPMRDYLTARRAAEPGFYLARDGVHCDATGHWLIARAILTDAFGAKDVANYHSGEEMAASVPGGVLVLSRVHDRLAVLKDAYLNTTKHKRPEMKPGLPLSDALGVAARLDTEISLLCRANRVG